MTRYLIAPNNSILNLARKGLIKRLYCSFPSVCQGHNTFRPTVQLILAQPNCLPTLYMSSCLESATMKKIKKYLACLKCVDDCKSKLTFNSLITNRNCIHDVCMMLCTRLSRFNNSNGHFYLVLVIGISVSAIKRILSKPAYS